MAKNRMQDLNDHLFAQLERLNDESITGEKLTVEINRAKVMSGVGAQVVNLGRLVLDAEIAKREHCLQTNPLAQLSAPPAALLESVK